jgi:hypothetical protein
MTIQRPEGMPLPAVEPQVTITSPTEGALTPAEFEVSGTAVPVEAAQRRHYWVVINPKGTGNYWPQGGPIAPSPPGGNWTVDANLGGVNNSREVFHVAVVRADESAHSSFTTYLEEGAQKKHTYPGREWIDRARELLRQLQRPALRDAGSRPAADHQAQLSGPAAHHDQRVAARRTHASERMLHSRRVTRALQRATSPRARIADGGGLTWQDHAGAQRELRLLQRGPRSRSDPRAPQELVAEAPGAAAQRADSGGGPI